MEKGSVLPSPARSLDEKVKGIPLPSQLPKGIDFSEIPMAALKSATLESLLSQNEDLMARLTVALRKVHQLEEAVAAFESEKKTFQGRFQTLKEQFLILQEKDRSATERSVQQYQENVTLKTQGERIEKLYADLYTQAQALQKRLVRLERYRIRIQKAAPGIQKKSKLIRILERDFAEYKTRLNAQAQAAREEMEARLHAAEESLARVKAELTAANNEVIKSYESQLAEAHNQIQELKPKADDRDEMYEKLLKLENQRIFDQRQFDQTRAESEERMNRLQQDTAALRQEVKELLVDREGKAQEITKITSELPHLREQNQNLVEQVESLQALWNQKQRELEQAEEKNKSLQKLNQALSVTINQQRKEIQNLKTEMDVERFKTAEKIQNLTTEIQLLRDAATKL